MSAAKPTFTDGLKKRLLERCGVCPTCGHRRWNSLRSLSAAIGVSPATLTRWLSKGGAPDAKTINLTVAYLAKEDK